MRSIEMVKFNVNVKILTILETKPSMCKDHFALPIFALLMNYTKPYDYGCLLAETNGHINEVQCW